MTETQNNAPPERQLTKKYKNLLEKRTNAIQSIEFHEKKVKLLKSETGKITAMSTLPLIEETFVRFKEINRLLEDFSEYLNSDLEPPSVEVEDTYIKAISKIKEITHDSLEVSILNSTQHNKHSNSREVTLPTITIPTFDGKYIEWSPFYDSFTTLIDQDDSISTINKFHYLKSFLKGSALSTINRIPVTERNYRMAWQLLKDRFHNKRSIVNSCLSTFINQNPIKKANLASVRNLIDTSKEALQCIEQFDVSTDSWSPFIVFTMETKLDKELKKEWENHLGGGTRIPLYQDMLNFLEMRARILENSPEDHSVEEASFSKFKQNKNQESSEKPCATKIAKRKIAALFAKKIIGFSSVQHSTIVIVSK